MSKLEPVQLDGFVLSPADVTDELPDVTQAELELMADIVADGLMESWGVCLEHAISIIEGDRRAKQ